MCSSARSIAALLASAAIVFIPPVIRAQAPVRLGLGGGISMPVGDIAKTSASGINLVASVTYDPRRLPIGFEANAAYHNFSPKGRTDGNSFIMAVTGGITIPITGTIGKPYLMAGVGYYNTQGPTTGVTDAERDIGGYGGIGIRFRGQKTELDVRAAFHEIFAEKNAAGVTRSRELIPISLTIRL
jgi:hypothetical protein